MEPRPELLSYRFLFDPREESPVFSMTGCPNRLVMLARSGVISYEEMAQLTEIVTAMLLQTIEDAHPGEYLVYKRENSYAWCGEEIWQGTPQRIAGWLRQEFGYAIRDLFKDDPLPTHEHGDGACKMEELEGEVSCMVLSRQEEEKHRRLVLREREEAADPERIKAHLAVLEKYGLIQSVKGGSLKTDEQGLKGEAPTGGLNIKTEGLNINRKEAQGLLKPIKTLNVKMQGGRLCAKAVSALEASGTPADLIRYVAHGAPAGYAQALNNPRSGNFADAPRILAAIMRKKTDTWDAEASFQKWLAKHPAPAQVSDPLETEFDMNEGDETATRSKGGFKVDDV